MISCAVYEYGYKQKELADYLGLYYSSISRILKLKNDKKKDLTP